MNKVYAIVCISACMIFFLYAQNGAAVTESELMSTIKRFAEVDDNLFRGGQPDEADLRLLKEYGIKKIINFRNEKDLILEEKKQAEALGFEYVSIPWTIYGAYRKEVADEFFAAIKDKTEKPVFFHCKRGSERTGVMAGLYKIKRKGLSMQEALDDTESFNIKLQWKMFVFQKLSKYAAENYA